MHLVPDHGFLTTCISEIELAVFEAYPDPTTYINTKYIAKHIFSHPDQYPVLGKYQLRFIKCVITSYLIGKDYPKYTGRKEGGRMNGQVFIRIATAGIN
jgi:hypothetical protein